MEPGSGVRECEAERVTDTDRDYWLLEGFDRRTEKLMEEHVLAGKRDREWGNLFGRPDNDPLLGEREVTEVEARQLKAHLGIQLDLVSRVYFVGRRRDCWPGCVPFLVGASDDHPCDARLASRRLGTRSGGQPVKDSGPNRPHTTKAAMARIRVAAVR